MSLGAHAREDGSFGRSAGAQAAKGAALLAVAVLIGVALLRTAPRSVAPPTRVVAVPATTAPNAAPPAPVAPGTTVPTHPASAVHLLVANGTTVKNLGARIRAQLGSAGYNTDKAAIDAQTTDHQSSMVYFVTPAFAGDAQQVATTLGVPATSVSAVPPQPPVGTTSLSGVDVVVIAGNDIAGNVTPTQPSSSATSTSTPTSASPTTTVGATGGHGTGSQATTQGTTQSESNDTTTTTAARGSGGTGSAGHTATSVRAASTATTTASTATTTASTAGR